MVSRILIVETIFTIARKRNSISIWKHSSYRITRQKKVNCIRRNNHSWRSYESMYQLCLRLCVQTQGSEHVTVSDLRKSTTGETSIRTAPASLGCKGGMLWVNPVILSTLPFVGVRTSSLLPSTFPSNGVSKVNLSLGDYNQSPLQWLVNM